MGAKTIMVASFVQDKISLVVGEGTHGTTIRVIKMIDENKYKQLKRKAEEAEAQFNRASGQLDAAKDRLKNEFDCTTLKAARDKLKTLKAEAEAAEATYDEAVNSFKEEWDALGED